ncbi:MAG: IS256 family transposase [Ruminococcus flavefaciens]|nr:IS256 family transposase [Ruminococcus flavefaciens]MCM1362913.1 IS256 family transposase [Clostridiales bacterium]
MEDIHELFKEALAGFMEGSLESELDSELGYEPYDVKNKNTSNSRNGHSKKTLLTIMGKVEIDVPLDRNGDFEPKILPKNQTSISQDMENKIISMYAKGMSTSDIEDHIRDIYGLEISDTTVSRITDRVLPAAREWQQRPLESVYAVVFLDAIHYHVRSEGQIVKKAVYIAIGVDLDGRKDVLGMWVGENESAKFWAGVLNSMRNRGVEDILIACTDNLTGFSQAIEAVFPKIDIQNCIIHQLRNSSKYVSYKDLKALMADLKKVYTAVDEESAMSALDDFAAVWDSKYPKISKSWYDNWANLSTYFKFPQELRKLIYTTNTIEGFNRQLKKVTKSKSVFPTDDSLFKMLYLAMKDITKKWTGRRQDWSQIYAQLVIYYGDRIPD